jgi:isoquinoline 1-oxidoreductase subunit beta
MSILELGERKPQVTRRGVLTGMVVTGGLAVGYWVWPRRDTPNLVAADGETVFNPWIKIARDGRVTIAVPQLEAGQGSYTALAQIAADELGADWRTVAIEPAPLNSAYDNAVFGDAVGGAAAQATGFSSTIRALADPVRQAAAATRALLCQAAGARWDADWLACDTENGFVVRGNDRLRFGELAEEAARFDVPSEIPPRDADDRLIRKGVPRLDAPAKLDGSANFAADIRLLDMVFASIRQGPPGANARLKLIDKAAAQKVFGLLQIIETDYWVAAVATNTWAANKAIDAMRPRFAFAEKPADTASVDKALTAALDGGEGNRVHSAGDIGVALGNGRVYRAAYTAGPMPHGCLEPFSATAAYKEGQLQLWFASQWPDAARRAAADAIGISADNVIVHVPFSGGAFGRNLETAIARQAAILAAKVERPVQLQWSRAEDMLQDAMRPPAQARMIAKMLPGGRIEGWQARIATPDGLAEMHARTADGAASTQTAVSGAIPAYAIPAIAIDHHPVEIGIPSGVWPGAADSVTAFFTESFIDELAKASGVEALSFRIALLGGNPRLAACLAKVAIRGGWEGGGPGTGQGLAAHMMRGAHVAVLAEAQIGDDQRVRVTRLTCVADVGRVINPDLARQRIEGDLLFGMSQATGRPVSYANGLPTPLRLGSLGLPLLRDMPEISVQLVDSREVSGGVNEIAVPPVAPAIANALFAATGRRFRTLPLVGA